ncbi:MAG: low temperature requirement protein A [Rhizobiales bacterium]|nr:low temperature requirement protein A [Hyphomicrobiales bacterium]
MSLTARQSHLRTRREHEHNRVTYVELFFDLVFVFAVTQLSHGLLEHLTPLGVAQTAVMMVAVWWAWIDTAWITNWLDPERPPVRLALFALMLAGLVAAASIPKAFEDRAVSFALAYIAMQVIRDGFMLWALRRHDTGNYTNFLRISSWHLAAMPLWIAGCYVESQTRLVLWALAVAFETAGPIAGFWIPKLGRSTTSDWVVEGGHMAERAALFVIIALGESVLVTGATFAGLTWTAEHIGAFLVAFAGSVAMWVVYFNIGAERSSRMIASSADPGRIARNGYTYLHILIVAGIIVAAVGDELTLHHPGGHSDAKTAIVLIAGPALYLSGNALFKRLSAPYVPLSHIVGLALLALLIPAIPILSPLLLSSATTIVLIIVATWESISFRDSRNNRGSDH